MNTTASTADSGHYEFGENWQRFVGESLTAERIQQARSHLLQRLQRPSLKGLTFLDIGCGSGLHSLAALQSGCRRVVSVDLDPQSVETTQRLWKHAGQPARWIVLEGSILDEAFVKQLPLADVVYAWGSLHHTGQLWRAIDQSVSRLADNGTFYTAIYSSEIYVNPGTQAWTDIKRAYNQSGPFGRRCWEWWCAWRFHVLPDFLRLKNPLRAFQQLSSGRGMEFWTDIRDWLGGWPIEFASVPEVLGYMSGRHHCRWVNLATGEGCSEYLFERNSAESWWQDVAAWRPRVSIRPPLRHVKGFCFEAALPELAGEADTPDQPRRSRWFLLENGQPLTIQHASPRHIQRYGGGRFRHWKSVVQFSSSDGTDPRTNEWNYELVKLEEPILDSTGVS